MEYNTKTKIYKYVGKNQSNKPDILGNVYTCSIVGNMYYKGTDGLLKSKDFTFPSAEHFWWAHFLSKKNDIERFAIGGDISINEDQINDCNIGLVAKRVSRLTNGKREKAISIGLEMSVTPFEAYGQNKKETIENIWNKILNNKFLQNAEYRRNLLSTGDEILVEYCKNESDVGFWNGIIKNGEDIDEIKIKGGELLGGNFMGRCLMACRKNINSLSIKPFVKLNPKLIKLVS